MICGEHFRHRCIRIRIRIRILLGPRVQTANEVVGFLVDHDMGHHIARIVSFNYTKSKPVFSANLTKEALSLIRNSDTIAQI